MDSLTYIKKKIKKFTTLVYFGQALIKISTAIAAGLFVFLLLDYSLFLPAWIRLVFLILVCIVGLGISASYKLNSLQELENAYPEFKGRLFASLSSYRASAGYSTELINGIRAQTHKLLKSTGLGSVTKKQIKPLLKPFIISCISAGIVGSLLPSPKSGWVKRFVFPNHKFLSLTVYPGDLKLAYGDSLKIEVKPQGLTPRQLSIIANGKSILLNRDSRFSNTIEVTTDITYYAKLRDVTSDTHKILVMLRPWIKDIELTYTYPQYTKVPSFVSDIPAIEALYGTQIEIKGEANVSLDSATIHFKHSKDIVASVDGDKFQVKFNITQNDTYQLLLLGSNGLKNTSPESWHIRIWVDEPPKVEVLFPATDIELPVSMKVPIIFRVSDDYGISKTKLVSDKGNWVISNEIGQDTVVPYEWDLSDIPLLPGDIVKYWIEVYDNDAIKGPKVTKSVEYRVYFPRLEDIYEQLTQEQTESISELENVVDELQKSNAQLEKWTSQPHIGEEEKEEIKKALAKMKEIEHKIKEVDANLNELYKTAEKSWLVDKDLGEKLQELQNLYKELKLPQLNEAIRRVEEALQKNPELLAQALKNLNLTQEEIRKRVERTIELLKQFRNEQTLKLLADKANELEAWQKDITERTEQGDSLSSLSKEETELREELNELAEDLEKLSKDMQSLSEELNKEAERASFTVEQLSEAAAQLSKGKRPINLQHRISNQLKSLSSNLNSLYQHTVQGAKEKLAREMRKLETELLFLSFEEESVGMYKNAPLDRAFRQEAIIKGTKIAITELNELMKITPFISQATSKYLYNSLSSMEQAKFSFEEGDLKKGEASQQIAMSELNKAVAELMKSEDALQKACSGSGLPMLMQQLSQLTQNQQSLNQLLQSLLPLNLMPSDIGEQLMQLSAQQQTLAEELQKIAQGLKGKVLGDLGGIAQEMERIAQDIKQGVTKEIVEHQKRVLKHLLDSQKSIYTKKFSRRRISEPGKDFTNLPSPPTPELITKRGISQKEILNSLNRLNSSNGLKEYEQLIRAYFRVLSTE